MKPNPWRNWPQAGLAAFLVLATLFLPGRAGAALGDHIWSMGLPNGSYADVDEAGNVSMFTTFFGTMDFGGGPITAQNSATGDVVLVRYDSAGNYLWARQFTPINQAGLFQLTVATGPEGNTYVAGWLVGSTIDFGGGPFSGATESVGVIACFDEDGQHLWSFEFGSGTALDIVATTHGVTGVGELDEGSGVDFGGGLLTSAGQDDIFLFRLAPDGSHVWSRSFGDADRQSANAIDVDAAGNVHFAGSMFGAVDFGGGALTASGIDFCFAKLDTAGNHVWSRLVGGTLSSGASIRLNLHVAVGPGGKVGLGGSFRTDIELGGVTHGAVNADDMFLVQFDVAGSHEWSATYGGTSGDAIYGLDYDNAGNVVVGTYYRDPIDLGGGPLPVSGSFRELGMAIFDPAGAHVYSTSYGGGTLLYAYFDGSNNVRMFGYSGTVDFGGGAFGTNFFLAKVEGTTNTPVGTNVPVVPLDQTTGTSPVTMTFDDIATSGSTSLVTSSTGPPPPGGLSFGSMATYYDLATTASFSGAVEVCFHYDEASLPGPEVDLTLQNYDEAIPGWVDITSSLDTTANVLCGTTTSFSPFAIAAPEGATAAPLAPRPVQLAASPNPFNPRTTIRFELETEVQAQLRIFDVAGRQVRVLHRGALTRGEHRIEWDGRDASGQVAASGTYFAVLESEGARAWAKLVLLK